MHRLINFQVLLMRKYTPLGTISSNLEVSDSFEEWARDKYLATSGQETRECTQKVQIANPRGKHCLPIKDEKSSMVKVRGKDCLTEVPNSNIFRCKAAQTPDEAGCMAVRAGGDCGTLGSVPTEIPVDYFEHSWACLTEQAAFGLQHFLCP